MRDPWNYIVPIVNKKTGERRTVVVTLTEPQRRACITMMAQFGYCGGPPARTFAMERAKLIAPRGFMPDCDGIERVTVH